MTAIVVVPDSGWLFGPPCTIMFAPIVARLVQ